jgi:hypothetical protein
VSRRLRWRRDGRFTFHFGHDWDNDGDPYATVQTDGGARFYWYGGVGPDNKNTSWDGVWFATAGEAMTNAEAWVRGHLPVKPRRTPG